MRNLRSFLAVTILSCSTFGVRAQVPAAITFDPAPDKANPAAMSAFQLPSHGALLNALVYIAPGAGRHPVIILLHGFPGNEKNLDLAQTLRRAGYDVLYLDYRGSWGSPGDFSFSHSIEDTQAAIAYMRNPAVAARLRADPKQIILAGHSMVGFLARFVAAQDPAIKAVILISAADVGVDRIEALKPEQRSYAVAPTAKGFAAEGMAPLAGCTPTSLAEEVVANADAWNTPRLGPRLADRPLLVITSDDGLAGSNEAFVAAARKAGATQVKTFHIATDHSYSDRRIELESDVLGFLKQLP